MIIGHFKMRYKSFEHEKSNWSDTWWEKQIKQCESVKHQRLKSCFYTNSSSDTLMPEVMTVFFYTMALRWRPCVTLLLLIFH